MVFCLTAWDCPLKAAGTINQGVCISTTRQQSFCGDTLYQMDSFFTIHSGAFCNRASDWHTTRMIITALDRGGPGFWAVNR